MKILIIRCGALGDMVYATSVIDALRYEYGNDVQIDFVATPSSGKLFECDKRVNRVFELKHRKVPIFFSKQKRDIINHSKKEPYDILINFETGKQFKSLTENIHASKKAGWFWEEIIINTSINRAEQQKHVYSSVVSKNTLRKYFPHIATLDFEVVQRLYDLENEYIIVSPSNSHVNRGGINYRAWKNEYWRKLIANLSLKKQIVIVGSKSENNFFDKLRPFPNGVIDLVGKNSVAELSTLIKYAKFSICTDSSIGHISAATNTPVAVLMGPNSTTIDSPMQTPNNKVFPISLRMSCSPCYNTEVMKNCKDNICMKNITPEMVLEELSKNGFL